MEPSTNELLEEARGLPLVPLHETTAYRTHMADLIAAVDNALAAESDVHELIGHNPLQVMYENHKHHAHFMATVFSIGNYELLAKTVPWVYRAYHSHRFSYDYFPRELRAWMRAIRQRVTDCSMETVLTVYGWMIGVHERMIELSRSELPFGMPIDENWLEMRNDFQSALLRGDHRRCLAIARNAVPSAEDVEGFYLHILQPALYEVGILWERGEISVAHEHIASAIVGRVMSALRASILFDPPEKGRAVVSASPNEFHEIGPWMISDILELDGWDVRYVGANAPQADLMGLLREFRPDILALSVTMPFNIENAAGIIREIRNADDIRRIRVLVGGRAFNETSGLWRSTGADAFAPNLQDARRVAGAWAA